jgi:AcrR family transcriptional regulator
MSNDSTKDLLIRAAKRLFAEKGYDGSTVKEVADLAGVNVSLVSYHFQGKENLYRLCMQEYAEARLGATEKFLKGPESSEDMRVRLTLMIEESIDYKIAEPELNEIMNRDCMSMNPITRDIYESVFSKAFLNLVNFFKTAQSKKILTNEVVPEDRAMLFIGGLIHVLRTDAMIESMGESFRKSFFAVSLKDQQYRDRLVKSMVRMAMEGSS